MKMCKKLDKGAIPRAAKGGDNLFTVVVYLKGEKESLEAPEPGDVLVHPKEMKNLEITITNTECGRTSKPTDVRFDRGLIIVELSGELTNGLGKGVYRLDLTYDEPNSHYADGKRHIALSKVLCNVVDPKDATEPMAAEIRLEVQAMLKGDKGDSAYEWAVKKGLCSTPEQFVEVFRGETGLSAYELYLKTTEDNPKLTEQEWLNQNNIYGGIHRILRGKNVPMEGNKLTGEKLIELYETTAQLASALRSKDIEASEAEGLASFVDKVKAYNPVRINLFTEGQLKGWEQTSFGKSVEIYDQWGSPTLKSMFEDNKRLEEFPSIIGADRVDSIEKMASGCDVLRGEVRLPDMPHVTSAYHAFSGCHQIERVEIGDLPENKSISMAFMYCGMLKYAEFGAMPKLKQAVRVFRECSSLERVVFKHGLAAEDIGNLFENTSSLVEVEGVIDVSNITDLGNIVTGSPKLKEIRIKGLCDDLYLYQSPNISLESLRYLIDNAQTVTGKSITISSKTWDAIPSADRDSLWNDAQAKGFVIKAE